MFGLLFGYGVATSSSRQTGTAGSTRLLLWRRSLVLIVIGSCDAMLFYVGDILAAYGVLLFFGVWAIRWKDRWLLIDAALFFVAHGAAERRLDVDQRRAAGPGDAAARRVSPVRRPARRGAVHRAARPDRLRLPVPARPVGRPPARSWSSRSGTGRCSRAPPPSASAPPSLGAQPVALLLARVIDPPSAARSTLIGPLHDATGTLGGFGYAALAALLSSGSPRPRGRVTARLAATGQRSLTCYLASRSSGRSCSRRTCWTSRTP